MVDCEVQCVVVVIVVAAAGVVAVAACVIASDLVEQVSGWKVLAALLVRVVVG